MRTGSATAAERTAHVLIVVEDESLRDLLQAVLDEEGYTVATAPDAAQGLERIQASRSPLVVLNAVTPHAPGVRLLGNALRDQLLAQRHAFVLLTTSVRLLFADLSHRASVRHVSVVELPFDLEVLLGHVAMAAQALAAAADMTPARRSSDDRLPYGM